MIGLLCITLFCLRSTTRSSQLGHYSGLQAGKGYKCTVSNWIPIPTSVVSASRPQTNVVPSLILFDNGDKVDAFIGYHNVTDRGSSLRPTITYPNKQKSSSFDFIQALSSNMIPRQRNKMKDEKHAIVPYGSSSRPTKKPSTAMISYEKRK